MRVLLVIGLLLPGVLAAGRPERLAPGATTEFDYELPRPLREIAGGGALSPVTRARVSVAVPAHFTPDAVRPLLIVNATTDVKYRSSRRLAGFYTPPALAAGWIVLAVDPVEDIPQDEDTILLRLALARGALAALERWCPGVQRWPIALAGFSGGAKISGYLAALFALEGRIPLGVFQAGINENTLASSARQFRVRTPEFKAMPVFLLAGEKDEIAPESDHRRIANELKRAGFTQVRVETFAGPHAVDPRPLQRALEWFRAVESAAGEPPPDPPGHGPRPRVLHPSKSDR
jgi:predicted esterase